MRWITAMLIVSSLGTLANAQEKNYAIVKTIPLGGDGGWDYVTVDFAAHRVYVTRSSHSMIMDSQSGTLLADIKGQQRSHGVAVVPEANRGFISDGGNEKGGAIHIFDLKTNELLGKIDAPTDADGIIYDDASKRILCVCGSEKKLIAFGPDIDPKNGKVETVVDLGGEPEFLATDGQGKAFVNLMDTNEVAVVDTQAMKLITKYPVAPGGAPVGMAIDREEGRLFIGCRKPQKMIVMNATDGKILADLDIGAGVDAVKLDQGDAFASCRDGTLAVVRETSPGKFQVVQSLQTKMGSRTMGADPQTHELFVPAAEFEAPKGNARPAAKPGSFMILVVARQ